MLNSLAFRHSPIGIVCAQQHDAPLRAEFGALTANPAAWRPERMLECRVTRSPHRWRPFFWQVEISNLRQIQ